MPRTRFPAFLSFSPYELSVSYSNAAKFSVNMEDDLLNLSNSRVLELEDKQN